MHVMPKQIAFAAVAAVLLAVVLFWQGAADGVGQPQLETAAESGSAPARAEKGRDGARYEKIRGMESQVAVEDLRNPFSPGHEKRGEAAAVPVKAAQKAESAQNVQQPAPPARVSMRAEAAPEMPVSAPEPVLALRGIVQGAEPLVILSDGAQSRSWPSASTSSATRSSRSAGRVCGFAAQTVKSGCQWLHSIRMEKLPDKITG